MKLQLSPQVNSYLELTKPRITWLIVLSTAIGYYFGHSAFATTAVRPPPATAGALVWHRSLAARGA